MKSKSMGLFLKKSLKKCPKNGHFDKRNKVFHKSKADHPEKLTRARLFNDFSQFEECPYSNHGFFQKKACRFGFHLTRGIQYIF